MSTDQYNNFSYDIKEIAQRIKKIRKDKNMSMYQLSLNSGVDTSVIRRIEIEERQPYVHTLLKIIDGLDMTPTEFFKGLE